MAATSELDKAVEVVKDRLYWVSLRKMPSPLHFPDCYFFSIDRELQYLNFFLDYGPLSMAQGYRYCKSLKQKLESDALKGKKIYHVCSHHPHKRNNSVVLLGMFQVLFLNRSADEAFQPFKNVAPRLIEFHDASPLPCTYKLNPYHCIRGIARAHSTKVLDIEKFDLAECEYYENVENGDLNWIIQDRCMAFAGPQHSREAGLLDGYSTLTPEDYFDYFKKKKILTVIRLNKKYYDERRFDPVNVKVNDIYFRDGSTPTLQQVQAFNKLMEAVPEGEGVGVHCKAGLGRTGTLIGCYLMKHYNFTHFEAIGWIRICRPGSIIGPQQHFLQEMQSNMWRAGDDFRKGTGSTRLPYLKNEKKSLRESLVSMLGALSTRKKPAATTNGSNGGSSPSSSMESRPGDEWVQTQDANSGRIYYYNRRTRKSTWTLPDGVVPTIRPGKRTQGDGLLKAKRSPTTSPMARGGGDGK